jgi:hypothetical protein
MVPAFEDLSPLRATRILCSDVLPMAMGCLHLSVPLRGPRSRNSLQLLCVPYDRHCETTHDPRLVPQASVFIDTFEMSGLSLSPLHPSSSLCYAAESLRDVAGIGLSSSQVAVERRRFAIFDTVLMGCSIKLRRLNSFLHSRSIHIALRTSSWTLTKQARQAKPSQEVGASRQARPKAKTKTRHPQM